jgi:hypothetical protein
MVYLLNAGDRRRQPEFLLILDAGHTGNSGDRESLSGGHLPRNDAQCVENLMDLHSGGAQMVGELIDAIQMIVINNDGDSVGHVMR